MQGTREPQQRTPEYMGVKGKKLPLSSAGNGRQSCGAAARSSAKPVSTGNGKETAEMAAERRGIVYTFNM